MTDHTARDALRERLVEAQLAVEHFIAGDGYPAMRVRSNEDAADLALSIMDDAVDAIVAERVKEELTGALHPEFGTEWREPDGVIYQAIQQAREQVLQEVIKEVHAMPLGYRPEDVAQELKAQLAASTGEGDRPRCWRSECRNTCYYPDVCATSTGEGDNTTNKENNNG